MSGLHEVGAAYRRDQNVRRARDFLEIAAARMHNRHGCITAFAFLHEQKRKRFSHNHAPAQDDDVRAGDVDLAFDQQALNAERGARNESVRRGGHEFRDVFRMKSIDIFARIERPHDCRFIDLFRRRRLHQNSVNGRIAVQLFDPRK